MIGRFVYFPPGRKQFYFSEKLLTTKEYPLLYKPLKLRARVLWCLINKFRFIRKAFTVRFVALPENIQTFIEFIGSDEEDRYQINQGTEGAERKTTIIRHQSNGVSSFYKIGTTDIGKKLIRNEYGVLRQLNGNLTAPKVLSYSDQDDFIVLESSYMHGEKNTHTVLNQEIVSLLIEISKFKLVRTEVLVRSFSHGDFCPWNILYSGANYHVIDWEMSDIRPLGYDLYTYIFQTALLLQPNPDLADLLEINKSFIKAYFDHFGIIDTNAYLRAFVVEKILLEANKADKGELHIKYEDLKKRIDLL